MGRFIRCFDKAKAAFNFHTATVRAFVDLFEEAEFLSKFFLPGGIMDWYTSLYLGMHNKEYK